jgi:hypothetical protein
MSTNSDAVQMQAALATNKLASAVLGIALAAIVVAYLQRVFGNDTTSNALWKTNRATIEVLTQHRNLSLGPRLKVRYPRISLKLDDLVDAAGRSARNLDPSTINQELATNLKLNRQWLKRSEVIERLKSPHEFWHPLEPDDATVYHLRKPGEYRPCDRKY